METAVTEGHRFDRAARYGAADRDRLQLGDDDRDETVRHRRRDQVDERHARLGRAGPGHRIDADDLVQVTDVDLRVGVLGVPGLRHLMRNRALVQ
jgi:hypothetical protein